MTTQPDPPSRQTTSVDAAETAAPSATPVHHAATAIPSATPVEPVETAAPDRPTPATRRRSWWGARATRIVAAVIVVLGAALAAFAWAFASPVGAAPDDNYHLSATWCPSPINEHCPVTTAPDGALQVTVPAQLGETVCYWTKADMSASCVYDIPDDGTTVTRRMDDGLYPGGYYDIMHLAVGPGVMASVLRIRAINAGLAIVLCAALGFLLTPALRRCLAYLVIGAALPLPLYLVASTNPSGWAIIGVGTVAVGLSGAAAVPVRWRRWALLALAVLGAAIASMARADAAAYCVLTAVVVGVFHLPRLRRQWGWWIAGTVVIALGVVGYLSAAQHDALATGLEPHPERAPGMVLTNNLMQVGGLVLQIWMGALGWLDTPLPYTATVLAMVVFAGLLFWGLRHSAWTKGLAIAVVAGAMVALPLMVLQSGLNLVGEGVQARYIVPLGVVLLWLALLRPDGTGIEALSPIQAWLAWGSVSLAHCLMLFAVIRRYVTGIDVTSFDLNQGVEWWHLSGPSPMVTWIGGSVGFALAALVIFLVAGRNERLSGPSGTGRW